MTLAHLRPARAARPERMAWVRRAVQAGLLGTAATLVAEQPTLPRDLSAFRVARLAGFTVLLSPEVQADPALYGRLSWRLEEQLRGALAALPAGRRAELRQVRVWLSPLPGGTSEMGPTAYYLLLSAGHQAPAAYRARLGDITVVDAQKFIARHGQYNLMLHELSHAYDDRRLNMADPGVLAAFQAARASDRYGRALGEHGTYAMTRSAEYFAELSVAFFDTRGSTPHNRAELRAFDPAGHAAIAAAWGVPATP